MKRTGRILPLKTTGDEPSLSEQSSQSGREPSLSGDHARAEEWREMTPQEFEDAYLEHLIRHPRPRRFSLHSYPDGLPPESVRTLLMAAGWIIERNIHVMGDRNTRGDYVRFEGVIPDEVATQPGMDAFVVQLLGLIRDD